MLVVLAGVKVERDSTITAEQRLLVRAGVVAARDRALSAEAQEQQRERSHPSKLRTNLSQLQGLVQLQAVWAVRGINKG